jgi:diguanylate cyclase (GGDEF)-like protein
VEDSDEIFCTEQLVKMLDLSLVNWHNNYVPRAKNEAILQEKIESLFKEEEEEDIYRYEKSDGEVTWIRIQSVKNENSELSVFMDVTASMEDKMKIAHDRDHDGLTNLYNRWAFNRKVEKLLISGKCTTGVLTIWDLDHLKHVNDTYGHERGDQYICSLARALDSEQFAYYIPARMAGDEFMTFIYNDTIENMYMRMTQIHQRFSQQTLELPDGQILEMSVSAGMAVYPNDAVVYQDLMENADFAMYEVKKSGRGNIKAFTGRDEKEGTVADSQS